MYFQRWILCLLLMALWTPPAPAQAELRAPQGVVLYAGPGKTYVQVATLNADQPFNAKARNRLGNWIEVEHNEEDAISGWVMTGELAPSLAETDLTQLPLTDLPAANMDFANTAQAPTILYETPVLPEQLDQDRLRAIYERGQARGNAHDSIVKIGDCNTASGLFLSPLVEQETELGPYNHLEDTVGVFRASFNRRSIASRDGFNASSIFDPMWAVDETCNPNEPPLLCEYRNNPSSVAFIMFGQNDVFALNREQYEAYLRDVIERSLDYGVIPVLSTFTNRPEFDEKWHQVVAMNIITIELADEYNIPLINFWLAARDLPGYGIGDDFAHLTAGGETIAFSGREADYGLTLYNLSVLTMLDMIYHQVIEETP